MSKLSDSEIRTGAHVMATQMAADYTPPSASLNPGELATTSDGPRADQTSFEVAAVLHRATNLLAESGWRQDTGYRPDGDERLIITDAITVAIHGSNVDLLYGRELNLYHAARGACRGAIRQGDWLLTEWNEAPGRTAADVRALLLMAARSLTEKLPGVRDESSPPAAIQEMGC